MSEIIVMPFRLRLAHALGEIQNPARNAMNPHLKKSYTDLAGVINAWNVGDRAIPFVGDVRKREDVQAAVDADGKIVLAGFIF